MLASLRSGLNTWVARLFFLFLVALFVAWGVGSDILRLISGGMSDSAVATVGGQKIALPALQQAYRQDLARAERALAASGSPPLAIKQEIAREALAQLITQAALTQRAEALGLTVPDMVLRQVIRQMPAFRGANGQFDQSVFLRVLTDNDMNEAHFLALLRQDILHREMLVPVRAGALAPALLARDLFAFEQETRIADMVSLPFAAAAKPPPPPDSELTRWYENHKDLYQTPEMRRIQAVVLTPAAVAKDVTVSEKDLLGLYDQEKDRFAQPEKRSADVVLLSNEQAARALATEWAAGAAWPAIEAAAGKQGGTPVAVAAMSRDQIPSPELAKAIFSATVGTPPQMVQTPLGWYVFRLTQVVPAATKTVEQATPELRQQVIAEKAADLVYERANKIDDLLAGGVPLDKLPGDLGLIAVSGTLDAAGNTPGGQPAPLPGDATVQKALLAAAFKIKPGDPPHLISASPKGGDDGYFAVTVEKIIPPAPKPFAAVRAEVQQDWTQNAIRHTEEKVAAETLTAVKNGAPLAVAAAGLPVVRLPPVSRNAPAAGVPPQLVAPLFGLKPGQPTMVETADGFVVAQLVSVHHPDPAQDPIGYGQIRDALTRSVASDLETIFTEAVRTGAKPQVNDKLLATLTQPE
jgi:peptidyl-prolyl cis-trans isomerase D